MGACLSSCLWALKPWLCVTCLCAVIDTGVLKTVSLHILGQLSSSGCLLFSASRHFSLESIQYQFTPLLCLGKSLISINSPLSLAGKHPHCHFCISVFPMSQGRGVTQAMWTTPWPLIYTVFQAKAPPRGLYAQAHRKASFTQSFIELLLHCVTV